MSLIEKLAGELSPGARATLLATIMVVPRSTSPEVRRELSDARLIGLGNGITTRGRMVRDRLLDAS